MANDLEMLGHWNVEVLIDFVVISSGDSWKEDGMGCQEALHSKLVLNM